MAEAKASARIIDMSNVKEGGGVFNKRRIPAGDYAAKVVKVEDAKVKKGDNEGEPQYLFTLVPNSHPANKYPYYCTLVENQLWKLRNIMQAAGINVPKKKLKVDPNKAVGRTIGVTMEDDEYEGKMQSVVAAVFPASELDAVADEPDDDEDDTEDETEDEEETEDTEEDEEEEEEDEATADAYDAMDRPELKKAIKAIDDSFRITKSMTDDDLRGALRNAADDDEEEEEDEEEEPPPPKKKAKKAKKSKKAEVTDDDLEELEIEDV